MENDCYFVNSVGLLKSCIFHPNNSENENEYLIEMIKGNMMYDGMTIHVKGHHTPYFIEHILPCINNRFILVTGDSDTTIPDDITNHFHTLLSNPFLIKWFAQNYAQPTVHDNKYNKIFQLPIGLDYHTISNNPHWYWRNTDEPSTPSGQENILMNIRLNSQPFYNRELKIFVNFSLYNDRFNERIQSINNISKDLLIGTMEKTPRTLIWNTMSRFSFVLSPKGNGMDCHRVWEILCLGCIPIVKGNVFKELFTDLPVLSVHDWNEVNEELLKNTIVEFRKRTFNYTKLTLKYWLDIINK